MTTLFQSTTESPTNPSAADFEPDEQWKNRLKLNIENNLRSMVDEAKQNLHDTLKRAPVSALERERLTEEHLATMKNIRILAEEQFRIALERERQERRWAAGQVLDQGWSDSMAKEQQAILDKIERERKDKDKDKAAAHPSSSSQPIADPSISRSSRSRSPERVWTPHERTELEHEADYFHSREFEEDHVPPPRDTGKARAVSVSSVVGSYKHPSTLDTTDRSFERPKLSPTIDEVDDMPRSARSPTDAQDSIRRGSLRRKASISTRQLPEFWLPSITPEQDAQMSRTYSLARRGSTASTSSYRAPSVLNIPFSAEPHDMIPSAMERDRERMIERERERISAMDLEWSPMERAKDRERTTSYTYAEARGAIASTPQRLDDRYPPPLSSVTPILNSAISYTRPLESPSSTVPIAYTRPADSPSSTVYTRSDNTRPPPSASRPIATKKSFTFDDGGFQSSPSPKGWTGPSRSPYDTRYETSRSPQTPEEIPRSWQSSNMGLRARVSSQDMRYGYNNAGESGYYSARPVHTHREVEYEHDVDLDGVDWREYDERQMRQREDSVSLRRREEEVARREQELRRREDDARREEEAKLKEEELKRKEEETKRKEEETRRKEDEIRRKEVEARRRQEEADRKELEVRRMEEEARKKEEETKRKEDEIQRKEMLARKKEEEVRRQEAQARKRAEDLRRQEEEVARRLEEEEKRVALEISRKSMEAKRKEDEVKRKEEDARLKEEAARAKEEEIQRKEEELLRREEELLRREAEAIRRSDDKQKVQQDEFRKREEEIRRQRAEEKKKSEKFEWESWGYYPPETSRPTPPPQMAPSQSQSSSSSTGPWPIPNRSDRSMPGPSPPTDRSSFGSTSTNRSSAGWTSSTRPSSTASSHPPSTPKPPTPSAQQNAKAASGPPPTPLSEAEFHRRQAEQAQQREEQFRREQAKLEQERLLKAGKALGKQDTIKLFEHHRGQWDKLQISGGVLGVLIWDDFPWPVFKRPSGPDDVTAPCITAYMLSSLHPTDKSPKDRIKENIRRWHPDRFETQLLPKVKESDRDIVREAAGTVVRVLNDLLRSSTQEIS
ncbi:hypothetical protein BDR03DRAFT_970088 [Suillus americanus]|nr:hypothetical protein BDR03DRAFT_970088 [Suillus americanus]